MYSVSPIASAVTTLPVLVATPVPNTQATVRVSPIDVAPSFVNESVKNETRNSPPAAARSAPASAAPVSLAAQQPTPSGPTPASVQTNFLAQLIGQDSSPQAIVYLAQYEKLVAFSNVKYKPSNAGKPQAESLYAAMLRSETGRTVSPDAVATAEERAPSKPMIVDMADDVALLAARAGQFSQYKQDPVQQAQRSAAAYSAAASRIPTSPQETQAPQAESRSELA